jgi:hypothetical protein
MVTFFTATLVVSLVGLTGLLSLKRFEIATGRIVFGRLRPKRGGVLHKVGVFFDRVLPATLRYIVVMFFRSIRKTFHRLAAWTILHVERMLEKVLHTVRERTAPTQNRGEASSFLRAVADHKRKLLHQPMVERAIFDE